MPLFTLDELVDATELAALLKQGPSVAGKRVALILSGGNIDMAVLSCILRGETSEA